VLAVLFAGIGCCHGQIVRQDFETWPESGSVWSNYTHDGWVLSDGQVRGVRGGHGPTLGALSAWLHDYDATSNTWIRSPLMAHGVAQIQFQARRNNDAATPANQIFAVQFSSNALDWTSAQVFDFPNDAWAAYQVSLDLTDATFVRIAKLGDDGDNQFLGLDEIELTPPPGVLLSDLAHSPPAPSPSTPVHVSITAVVLPDSSNVVLRAFYRPGTSGVFTAINMTNTVGNSHGTVSPIPAGPAEVVEYYVECHYEGFGPSPVYLPTPGPAAPAHYTTVNPYMARARQLSPASRGTPLIISEIMYHPCATGGTETLEYIELFNTHPVSEDLSGHRLSGDVDFTFPSNTVIPARSFMVVAADPAAMQTAYGLGVYGPWSGNLPNNSGLVRLRNRAGARLLEVEYEDQMPWPIAADGAGHSLVLARPDFGEGDVRAWGPSRDAGGSPGAADPLTSAALDAVVVNEFLAHTDLPDIDYVELHNPGTQSVNLAGCILTEMPTSNRFVFPANTLLPPRGLLALTQTQLGFSLSSHGDDIYLKAPGGMRVIDAVRFPPQPGGLAVGRYPDGAPDWYALAAQTPGTANLAAGLRPEDVVINEIMFRPLSGSDDDEYVELYNRGTNPVDVGNWRFTVGIDFTFPPGTTIPADGHLVVARNVTNLLARYPQLHAGNALGNYDGRLADGGERLALARPEDPLAPVDYYVVNDVTYGDGEDWGRWTDGGGSSLELIDPRSDNRRAMNWAGSDETQKAPWTIIEHTGVIDNQAGTMEELQVFCPQRGECLLDNIEVMPDGQTGNRVTNPTFEGGLGGWELWGTHERSSVAAGAGYGGGNALHVRATSQGRYTISVYRITYDRLSSVLSAPPLAGETFTIRAKGRWIAGWPYIVIGIKGHALEAVGALDVPHNLGTPGLPNSRLLANAGPAIDRVQHAPVLPAANQPVVVSARVHDPDGVAAVLLRWRNDTDATPAQTLAMTDADGDGLYTAILPGLAAGRLAAFAVEATDAASPGITNRFPGPAPTGAPPREGLVRFGDTLPSSLFGAYRIWVTADNATRWTARPTLNNEPVDSTFTCDDYRTIYNGNVRYRGNWRIFPDYRNAAYVVDFPGSERFLGDTEVAIDLISLQGANGTLQQEPHTYWITRQIDIASMALRFVHVSVNGSALFRYDSLAPSRSLCKDWYGDDDPHVFEQLYPHEPFGNFTTTGGVKKQAKYRYTMRKKLTTQPNDDFSAIYRVADALMAPSDELYVARVSALADIRTWASYWLINRMCGNFDHYTSAGYPHNLYTYVPPRGQARLHVNDTDASFRTSYSLFPDPGYLPGIMFAKPEFRRVYWRLARNLAYGPMDPTVSDKRLHDWYDVFLGNGIAATDPAAMSTWITQRRASIIQSLAAVDNVPFALSASNAVTATSPFTVAGTAPVTVTTIQINGQRAVVKWTGETAWQVRVGLAAGTNVLAFSALDEHGAVVGNGALNLTYTGPAVSPAGQIVISEIMYHPPQEGDAYVEIYNRSPLQAFDLGGWRLNGVDFTFDRGAIIEPGQFRVIAEDRTPYQHTYGNVETVLGVYSGRLDHDGETLQLCMPAGSNAWTVINEVTYDDELPWPTEPNGGGQSLQLIDLTQDNNHPGNWAAISTAVVPTWKFQSVTGVVAMTHPTILAAARLHLHALSAGEVLLDRLTLVTGLVAEAGANLLQNGDFEAQLTGPWTAYGNHSNSFIATTNVHSGAGSLALVASGAGSPTNHVVSQNRPLSGMSGMPLTLSYWYRENPAVTGLGMILTASSISNSHSLTPPSPLTDAIATPGSTNTVAALLPYLPPLWINEVMASNVTAWADEFGEFDPWIELCNAGSNAIDLADIRLSNVYADPGRWAFPTGIVLDAGARILVWADGQTNQTAGLNLHANFRLNGDTGSVILALSNFGQHLVLDSLDYNQLGPDFSYGSYPEGNPHARQVFHTPTPGAANTPLSLPLVVVINEWMPVNQTAVRDPSDLTYDDWFELFNPSAVAVNLGGYFLTDDLSQTNKFTIPGGLVLPPGGFLRVWADEDHALNGPGQDLHVNFKLSGNGESIGLFRPDNTLMDAVTFGAMGADQSQGCWPDGAAALYPMSPPTPGTTNRVLLVTSLPPAGPAGFALHWIAQSGDVYRIIGSRDLIATNWVTLGLVTAASSSVHFTDTNAPAFTNRFYRVQRAE
jgi:hypothetical protein